MEGPKTVHVYTGSSYEPDSGTQETEPLDGYVEWDEGGVRVRTPVDGGHLVHQIPWTSVKYVVWKES